MSHCIRIIKGFLLLCSILSGALFAVVWRHYEVVVSRIGNTHSPLGENVLGGKGGGAKEWTRQLASIGIDSSSYTTWLASQGLASVPIPHEQLSYSTAREKLTQKTEAAFLYNQTKVLCMVMASSRNRSRALRHTWTKHCNEVVFFGKFADRENDRLVRVELLDNSLLSPRTFCRAFVGLTSSGATGKDRFDWLLITTDNTYAIVENLRQYLAPVNASSPHYIGRPVHHYFLGVYNALDSGIVLSRGAVHLLASSVFSSHTACLNLDTHSVVYSSTFDAYIGMLLARHSINPANSLDDGSSRFHPYRPEKHLVPELISVFDSYWSSNVLPIKGGFACCSEEAITFTGFSPVTFYFIEYLLYHLSAFTEADGHRGIGNMPSYESYRLPVEPLHRKRSKHKRQ